MEKPRAVFHVDVRNYGIEACRRRITDCRFHRPDANRNGPHRIEAFDDAL
jgi:hypothetical protein